MVVWIVVGGVFVLGLVYLALVARALLRRLNTLQAEQAGLEAAAAQAQELAGVAQGLQSHAEAVRVRIELAAQRLAAVSRHPR